jgi:chromosome partitioning protein
MGLVVLRITGVFMGFLFGNKEKEKSPNLNKANPSIPKAKIIAFLNQKGGVGKTTMAFNTAHALAHVGKKVLCVDMDPQSNLSHLFGVEPTEIESGNIFNLLINSVRELKPLHTGLLTQETILREGSVDLIPSSQDLSGFELSVAGISAPRQLILKNLFEKNGLTQMYDFIIIDSPPTLGLLVVNILCASSGVMVPFRPDEFSRKGLTHFYQVLEDIEEMGVTRPPQVLAHIPNLVDARRKQESDDLKMICSELEEAFGKGTVVDPFYNRTLLVKSLAKKKSVFDFSAKEFRPLQEQFNILAQRAIEMKGKSNEL